MRTLGTRDRRRGNSSRGREKSGFHLDLQALAVQMQARSPLVPPVPVPPEQRSRSYPQGMEQHSHLARLGCGASPPLALLA